MSGIGLPGISGTSAELTEGYGKQVNYPVSEDYSGIATEKSWKLLYVGTEFSHDGDSHIYLVSSSYWNNPQEFPVAVDSTGEKTTVIPKRAGTYGVSLEPVGSVYSSNVTHLDEKGLSLNPGLKSPMKINKFNFSVEKYPYLAYLLDTRAWKGLVDETVADFAIGSITCEMFIASYNAMNNVAVENGIPQYLFACTSVHGYSFSSDFGKSWTLAQTKLTGNKPCNFPSTFGSSPANGVFATPSDDGHLNLYAINRTQYLQPFSPISNGTQTYLPVVCLKSGCRLVLNDDGVYNIVCD